MRHLIKGGVCGVIFSFLYTVAVILNFFELDFSIIIYGAAVISAVLAFVFFLNDRIMKTVTAFLVSIVSLFICETVITWTGIINAAFKHVYGASAEMWAGDGFGMFIIFMFASCGYLLGSIVALIVSIIKQSISKRRE